MHSLCSFCKVVEILNHQYNVTSVAYSLIICFCLHRITYENIACAKLTRRVNCVASEQIIYNGPFGSNTNSVDK